MSTNTKNDLIPHYCNQSASGIGYFHGVRNQHGQGFRDHRGKGFGTILKSAIFPILKYLAPKAIQTGLEVVDDVMVGEPVLNSIKSRGKRRLRDIAGDVSKRASTFEQTGRGSKRRKKNTKKAKKSTKKRKRNVKNDNIFT